MKKLLFAAMLLGSMMATIQAQEFKLGFKLNPLIGFVSQTDDDGNDLDDRTSGARVGWMYGIVADYRLTDNYGIHTGFTIVNKGFTEEFSRDTLLVSDQNIRVTSIEIPVTALLRSNEITNGVYFKGYFGLSLDVNIGYRNEYTGSHPFEPRNENGTLTGGGRVRNLGLTFVVGPGIDWETGIGTMGLGVTFHQGLTNINSKKNTGNDIDIKPRYISFDVAYYF